MSGRTPGLLLTCERDCFAMGARDAEHPVAQTFHQGLELHGDEGLVLDNQHIGGDLGRKLCGRFLDQAP